MAVGARLLAKKQAIVSKLVAIEELAGVDVLCADKTGTLTQNKLTLGDPFSVNNIPAEQVILDAALASRADDNDTIDLAVLGGLKDDQALKTYQVVHFQPFDPVHKRTEATVKGPDGKAFKVTKGAPQVILELSANAAQVKAAVDKAVNEFAARGFRSLGVARADADGKWQFLGVLPLFDPPRDDAKATIATAEADGREGQDGDGRCAGHRPGDRQETRYGHQYSRCRAVWATRSKQSPPRRPPSPSRRPTVSHRCSPRHKFHIVDVLQKRGHIVGMTGDGVNDAPALKKADCGIAVSGATDAARAAASIVLMTPGLSVIIDAIKESRKIFQRMNSYAIYRIAETLRVLLFMTLAILVFNFYPVDRGDDRDAGAAQRRRDPVHRLRQRSLQGSARGLEHAHGAGRLDGAGRHRRRRPRSGCSTLASRVFHLDRAHIQTLMYLKLSVAGHLTIFLTRTRGPFWSIRPARDFMDRRVRHASGGDADCGVWSVHDAAGLGLGGASSGAMPWHGSS